MASNEESASESASDNVSVSQIPVNLLSHVRAKVLHYVSEAAEFSAEIQQIHGQPARLVISLGNKPTQPKDRTLSDEADVGSTNKILVKNIPQALDEEFIELFFESMKRQGGGPVRNTQLNRKNNWAIIEFFDSKAVKTVMGKRPITMLETIVDIQPYTPLLTGDKHIRNLEIQGLPKALTEEILDMHLKELTESDRVPVHTTQVCKTKARRQYTQDPEKEDADRKSEQFNFIIDDVESQKVLFVKGSKKCKEALKTLLKGNNAKVVWPNKGSVIKVTWEIPELSMPGDPRMFEVWKYKVNKIIIQFFEQLVLKEHVFQPSRFDHVLQQLQEIDVENPESVEIHVDKLGHSIKVVGYKENVQSLSAVIKDISIRKPGSQRNWETW